MMLLRVAEVLSELAVNTLEENGAWKSDGNDATALNGAERSWWSSGTTSTALSVANNVAVDSQTRTANALKRPHIEGGIISHLCTRTQVENIT